MQRLATSATSLDAYLKDVQHCHPLSPEESQTLFLACQRGDESARQRILRAYLRLVIHVAKGYRQRPMAFEDLIEEGNLGLMHALTKFDPERNISFTTYAVYWIRAAIERGVMMQARVVRLPVHVAKTFQRVQRHRRQLAHELGRDPHDREVAEAAQLRCDQVRALAPWAESPASLDNSHSDIDWHNLLPSAASDNPEQQHCRAQADIGLKAAFHRLSAREQRILTLRFGLENGLPMTLEAIAAVSDITRERVRQVQLEALHKLKDWLGQDAWTADCWDTDA